MPSFDTITALASHLRAALAERTCWVCLADGDRMADPLRKVLGALILAGVPETDLERDVGHGVFCWLDTNSNTEVTVFALTLPKCYAPPALFGGLLARAYRLPGGWQPDHDIVLLARTTARAAMLTLAASALHDGTVYEPTAGSN